TQNYSWGVSPDTPVLLDSLNAWLEVYLESKEYNKIYRKYTGVK
ncbi:MAG: glutamine ABC transporter substrate-binding protein, partial [Paludibacteraceae bacterium]|nr:glutamine ABC transporter substrate-binding protein [Paludibacteraceae bacterium]